MGGRPVCGQQAQFGWADRQSFAGGLNARSLLGLKAIRCGPECQPVCGAEGQFGGQLKLWLGCNVATSVESSTWPKCVDQRHRRTVEHRASAGGICLLGKLCWVFGEQGVPVLVGDYDWFVRDSNIRFTTLPVRGARHNRFKIVLPLCLHPRGGYDLLAGAEDGWPTTASGTCRAGWFAAG